MEYSGPERLRNEKASAAQKGLQKAKPLIALSCQEGILLVTQNRSKIFRKIRPVYKGIVLGAIGEGPDIGEIHRFLVYVAHAEALELDENDVNAFSLVTLVADLIRKVFLDRHYLPKILELVVAEVGEDCEHDVIYHIDYEGSFEEEDFVVLAHQKLQDKLRKELEEKFLHRPDNLTLKEAYRLCTQLLELESEEEADQLEEEEGMVRDKLNIEAGFLNRQGKFHWLTFKNRKGGSNAGTGTTAAAKEGS